MKKIILVLLVFGVALMTSCKKKYCVTCTERILQNKEEFCGTKDEVERWITSLSYYNKSLNRVLVYDCAKPY